MNYLKIGLKGVSWLGSLQATIRAFTFLKYYFIVKVLSPFDLGVFSIAMLLVGFFEVISDLGISSFLIHTRENENKYVHTAWVLSIGRGLLLTIFIIISSFFVITFFKQQKALPLILVGSLIPFFKGFSNPSTAKFSKHLTFHREFLLKSSGASVEAIAAIILVIILRNPIALIYSLLISSVTETFVSLWLISPRPKFIFEVKKAKEILHFSKWIIFGGIITYFSFEFDSIVVGRILGTTELGIYQIAQKFSLQVLSEGGDIFAKVSFPLFSKLKHSEKTLQEAFRTTLLFVGGLFGFLAFFLFSFSHEIILFLLGPNWLSAEWSFRFFAILGYASVLMGIVTSLFLSLGRQEFTAKLMLVRMILLIIVSVPLATVFKNAGASFASLVSFLAIYPFAIYYLRRSIKSS